MATGRASEALSLAPLLGISGCRLPDRMGAEAKYLVWSLVWPRMFAPLKCLNGAVRDESRELLENRRRSTESITSVLSSS